MSGVRKGFLIRLRCIVWIKSVVFNRRRRRRMRMGISFLREARDLFRRVGTMAMKMTLWRIFSSSSSTILLLFFPLPLIVHGVPVSLAVMITTSRRSLHRSPTNVTAVITIDSIFDISDDGVSVMECLEHNPLGHKTEFVFPTVTTVAPTSRTIQPSFIALLPNSFGIPTILKLDVSLSLFSIEVCKLYRSIPPMKKVT